MAETTLSTNLKLRLSSDLTADALYNLRKIDTLGLNQKTDNTGALRFKSATDIQFQPNSTDLGGTGVGGNVTVGEAGIPIGNLSINSDLVTFKSSVLRFTDGTDTLDLSFPLEDGTAGQGLVTDGNGLLSWATLTANNLTDSNISTSAGINLSKLASLATDRVLISDGSGVITVSSITPTELSYLSGLSSNIQAQIDLLGGANQLATDWLAADGLTKTVTHNFGTRNILIQVLNSDNNYSTIDVEVSRPTDNTAVLTASEVPASSWKILLVQIGS